MYSTQRVAELPSVTMDSTSYEVLRTTGCLPAHTPLKLECVPSPVSQLDMEQRWIRCPVPGRESHNDPSAGIEQRCEEGSI